MVVRAAKTRKAGVSPSQARIPLTDIAYEELKHRIITLEYQPGSYLNEAKLSDDLEIGRTPVHHAVQRLAHDGLIEMIPRKGLIVKPISLQDFAEIIEVRMINEVYCAGLASQRMTARSAAELKEILVKAEAFAVDADIESQMMLDREFHDKISQTAGNRILADFLRNLHERSLRIWFVSLNNEKHANRVRSDHWKILEALTSGDVETAEEAMRAHIMAFQLNIGNVL